MHLVTYNADKAFDSATVAVDVCSVVDPSRYLYTIHLAKIWSSEMNLKEGRFHSYCDQSQGNKIYIVIPDKTRGALMEWFTIMLNWLAEHSDGLWSVLLHMSDATKGKFEFSFENATAAVLFALVFVE